MSKCKGGFVYIASVVGNPNICKIGHSKQDPSKRVANLKHDYKGMDFELYDYYPTKSAYHSEMSIHSLIDHVRIERELFNILPCEARVFVSRGIDKNFNCMEINYEIADYCKSYIVDNMQMTHLVSLPRYACLSILNLCIELYNIKGSDAIYSINKRMIETVVSHSDIESMMESGL